MPHVTIVVSPPSRGFVELTGHVEHDGINQYDAADLAVMPFVWRFGSMYGGHDHGWRKASRIDRHSLDENGAFRIGDIRPGVQYAIMVVGEYFGEPGTGEHVLLELIEGEPGTLPAGALAMPEFTHPKYGIHIATTPDDHLTGTVLGVGRAAWSETGPEVRHIRGSLPFRMVAWVEKLEGTFFIGETLCEPSGYWTFGDLPASQKNGKQFTVALVRPGFRGPVPGAPSPIPPPGGDVVNLASSPHKPLLTHGSEGG